MRLNKVVLSNVTPFFNYVNVNQFFFLTFFIYKIFRVIIFFIKCVYSYTVKNIKMLLILIPCVSYNVDCINIYFFLNQ